MNGKGSYWFDYIHFGKWGGEVVSTIHRLNNNVPPITSHIPSDEKVFDPDTGFLITFSPKIIVRKECKFEQ